MNRASSAVPHMDRAALLALGVLVFVWGYNWVAMKIALRYAGPFDFAGLRTFGASLCLLLTLALFRRRAFLPRYPRATLLLGLLQTACFVGLVNLALVRGSAGKSSVLVYTMPFWVAFLAPLVLRETARRMQWLAIAIAFAGLMLILSPWEKTPDFLSSLLALGAGLFWALSVLVAKKIPVGNTWDVLSLTGWQMLAGSLVLILLALLIPEQPIHWTPEFIGALLYNIIPANAVAWFLWLFIVTRLPASVSSLNALAIPVVGVLAGWLQLGERPSPLEGTGMLLVFAALAVLAIGLRAPRVRES